MAKFVRIIKKAGSEFADDDCMSSGAAMAYYAIFALPPLLILIGAIAGYLGVGTEQIGRIVEEQWGVAGLTEQDFAGGDQGEQADQAANGEAAGGFGWIWRIVGAAILVFTATGLFAQLQYALNRAWGVQPDPRRGGVINFIVKRVLSFGMILVVLFLLLVSLVMTAMIDQVTAFVQGETPGPVAVAVGALLNNLAVLVVATLLFAAMFKVLPDAQIAWKDVWAGALMTALLFVAGKALIALYVQQSDFGTAWGAAAASLIAVLVWLYYSSLIVLFGAELTQVWAAEHGHGIQPVAGAVEREDAQ